MEKAIRHIEATRMVAAKNRLLQRIAPLQRHATAWLI
jgi:hypothetical protein